MQNPLNRLNDQQKKVLLVTVCVAAVDPLHIAIRSLGIDNNALSDALTIGVVPVVYAAKNKIGQLRTNDYDIAAHMFSGSDLTDEAALHREIGAMSAKRIQEIAEAKEDLALKAKYWILFGRAPESHQRESMLQELDHREAQLPTGVPSLDPGDALRILSATLVEISPEDRLDVDSSPSAIEWNQRVDALKSRLIEARFAMAAMREERADFQLTSKSLLHYDIPNQDQLCLYFFMTAMLPDDDISGRELEHKLHAILHGREHLDKTMARNTCLKLIGAYGNSPAIMPLRPSGYEPWRTFPIVSDNASEAQHAEAIYRELLQNPNSVQDSFVGWDGWHLMRARTMENKPGYQSIVAARGGEFVLMTDRLLPLRRAWELMKMDRARSNAQLDRLTEGAQRRHVMRENLNELAALAARAPDGASYTYTWPNALLHECWAESVNQFAHWRENDLPKYAHRNRVRRMAAVARENARIELH